MNFPLNKARSGRAGVDCHGACTRWKPWSVAGWMRSAVDLGLRGRKLRLSFAWARAQAFIVHGQELRIHFKRTGAQAFIVNGQELSPQLCTSRSSSFDCEKAIASIYKCFIDVIGFRQGFRIE